jgi:hypothetical protein
MKVPKNTYECVEVEVKLNLKDLQYKFKEKGSSSQKIKDARLRNKMHKHDQRYRITKSRF